MARSLGEKIGAGGRRRGGFYTPSPKSARWARGTPGTRSKDPGTRAKTGHPGVQDPGHPEWSETISKVTGDPGVQDSGHPGWSETIHPRPGTRGSRTPGTRGGQG